MYVTIFEGWRQIRSVMAVSESAWLVRTFSLCTRCVEASRFVSNNHFFAFWLKNRVPWLWYDTCNYMSWIWIASTMSDDERNGRITIPSAFRSGPKGRLPSSSRSASSAGLPYSDATPDGVVKSSFRYGSIRLPLRWAVITDSHSEWFSPFIKYLVPPAPPMAVIPPDVLSYSFSMVNTKTRAENFKRS